MIYLFLFLNSILLVYKNKKNINKFNILKQEIKHYNAKKNFIDISPLSFQEKIFDEEKTGTIRTIGFIDEAMKAIISNIRKTIEVKSAVFLMYDLNEKLLYNEVFESDEIMRNNKPILNKGNLLYWAIENNKELIDNLYVGDPQNLGIYGTNNVVIRSVIIMPVSYMDEVKGIIYIDSEKEQAFTLKIQELLRKYAQLASIIYKFAEYAKNSKYEAAYFSLLHKIVHEFARTLEYSDIIKILIEKLQSLLKGKYVFVVRLLDHKVVLLYNNGEMINSDYEFPYENSFTYLLKNNKDILFKSDIKSRSIKLPIFYKGEKIKNIESIIGIHINDFNEEYSEYIIIASETNMKYNKTMKTVLNFISDISKTAIEKSMFHKKMKELAIRDGLTGVYNHRFFQEELEKIINYSKRNNYRIALALIDIDYFKKFNDTYGHQIGDIVLKFVAETMVSSVRQTDMVARYGGEEFVIVFNNIQKENIFDKADEIRKKIENSKIFIKEKNKHLSVTISIGVSIFPDTADNRLELIKFADNALYKAKENGRNRVETN